MTDTGDKLDPSTGTEDLVNPTETGEEDDLELDEELDNEDEDQDDEEEDKEEEWEPQKPQKDYKQKFNSAMSNLRKLQREVELLKSNKSGDKKISDEDLATLRDKYDEEDLGIIEKIIKKNISDHESSKLAEKEVNIFLKARPEVTASQLKHLKFMQKEFGYSLKYAYDITFWRDEKKPAPESHSIKSKSWGSSTKKKEKEETDDDAFKAMQEKYGA